jgi:5'-methylthioadenosine phosphorylase
MRRLGIISGTLSLRGKGIVEVLEERHVDNEFGEVQIYVGNAIAFITRHGSDPDKHIYPHMINHRANVRAMKDLGVDEIISVNSTGSMKRHLEPGMLVVPNDFIMLAGGPPTIFSERAVHITPTLSDAVRRKWMAAARDVGLEVIDGGVYWHTTGPRLETKAEIAMMAKYADLVGMTMASEAVISMEMEIPFASLCSVDNYAHGLGEGTLTAKEITACAQRNAETIAKIVKKYIEKRG